MRYSSVCAILACMIPLCFGAAVDPSKLTVNQDADVDIVVVTVTVNQFGKHIKTDDLEAMKTQVAEATKAQEPKPQPTIDAAAEEKKKQEQQKEEQQKQEQQKQEQQKQEQQKQEQQKQEQQKQEQQKQEQQKQQQQALEQQKQEQQKQEQQKQEQQKQEQQKQEQQKQEQQKQEQQKQQQQQQQQQQPPSSEVFEDGKWPCSKFLDGIPHVQAITWLPFGGWTGIQQLSNGGSVAGDLPSCQEGGLCSYACEPGYLKTQYLDYDDAEHGRSLGGLRCSGGFLYKTKPEAQDLCIRGAPGVQVRNELGQGVAICQTDYPGTENMCIPTYVNPGETLPLAANEQESYYYYRGAPVSSQFYVNNAGVSKEEGCQWGHPDGTNGNWAPLNFGASRAGGLLWLSVFDNPLRPLGANYNVQIICDGEVKCTYENGVYLNGGNGCTAASSGSCTYRLYH